MFGEFANVNLSSQEFERLNSRFGPSVTRDYVEKLSCWLEMNPRKAKRPRKDYARLISWIVKDETVKRALAPPEPKTAPLIEAAELRMRAELMQQIREREKMPYLSVEELVARLKAE